MDENTINQYKNELMRIYKSTASKRSIPAASPEVSVTDENPERQNASAAGRLIGIITTLRGLYPVPGAKVTVFTGTPDNMNIIAVDTADRSGRTIAFELSAPSREISMDSASEETPYALYNMLVEADGYADNIHLNIPIFRGVTSLQKSEMVLKSAAGSDDKTFVYNEASKYNL